MVNFFFVPLDKWEAWGGDCLVHSENSNNAVTAVSFLLFFLIRQEVVCVQCWVVDDSCTNAHRVSHTFTVVTPALARYVAGYPFYGQPMIRK